MRTPTHVAGILAAMFDEFGRNRMRISAKTLKVVGKRQRLKIAHLQDVTEVLEEFDIALVEINRGYCLISMSSLDGERIFTFKSFKKTTAIDLSDENEVWEETSHMRKYEDNDE